MIHRLAVFYHCLFQGVSRPIDTMFALNLMADQMTLMDSSCLTNMATEICIGVNGDDADADLARISAPDKARIIAHGKGATTEIPTLNLIWRWLPLHPDWYVLYWHMKGISHPPLDGTWRRGMEQHLIRDWQRCVFDLDSGYDVAGCHWLTPEAYPGQVKSPFLGGNFWWAKAGYLMTLPRLPEPVWENRYEAENWIGRGPKRPRVKEYISGWPPHSA
jgi:hypothetical protein